MDKKPHPDGKFDILNKAQHKVPTSKEDKIIISKLRTIHAEYLIEIENILSNIKVLNRKCFIIPDENRLLEFDEDITPPFCTHEYLMTACGKMRGFANKTLTLKEIYAPQIPERLLRDIAYFIGPGYTEFTKGLEFDKRLAVSSFATIIVRISLYNDFARLVNAHLAEIEGIIEWCEVNLSKNVESGATKSEDMQVIDGKTTQQIKQESDEDTKQNGDIEESIDGYSFIHIEGVWVISFNDIQKEFTDRKGLREIAVLLDNPDREYNPFELLQEIKETPLNGHDIEELHQIKHDLNRIEPNSFDCKKLISKKTDKIYEQIDFQAVNDVENKIGRLEKELRKAEEDKDQKKINKSQEEINKLEKYLSKNVGIRGKIRNIASDETKLHNKLARRIWRVKTDIEKKIPGLGAHLTDSIKTRPSFVYAPIEKITWKNKY